MAREKLAALKAGLEARDLAILELALEGLSQAEIAQRAGCSERTVYRILDRLGQRLERLDGASA
jgi:DNA-binding CsgD family transcriptional regulator